MQRQNISDESSDEQGFFKPIIKIQTPIEITIPLINKNNNQEAIEANQLVYHERPTDYRPRILNGIYPFYLHQKQDVNSNHSTQQREEMIPIKKKQKIKKCKFLSLKEKYENNRDFERVYSKLETSHQFNSYTFNLENTTDYNANEYLAAISANYDDSSDVFDSRFESGNLLYAYKHLHASSKIEQYDLIMQNDTNTKGYNQWFYFSFKNRKTSSVKFNIVNFIKKHLMFQDGVRPVSFSSKENSENNINSRKGWRYIGQDIEYQKSYINREVQMSGTSIQKNYYTLSFTINFDHLDDKMYIALNFPYTYSKMISHLRFLEEKAEDKSIVVERSTICHTISNNILPCLRIRHKDNQQSIHKVLLMGRQHPGESVGSYVLQSFLNAIIHQENFLKKYELVVIPMLNPDGVIYGNFRTNLAGFDLNRQWRETDRWLHPQVYYVSRFISSLKGIVFVMDFHGHSKKLNSFIYSCTGEKISNFRIYPYIYSKKCSLFSVKDSTFNITADKMRTARVTIYEEIKTPQVYTLETSFFGYSEIQSNKNYRFVIKDFNQIGKGAVDSLVLFLTNKKETKQYQKQVKDKQYLFEQWIIQNKQDFGSESNPSEDQFTPFERKLKVLSDKKMEKKKSFKKKKKKEVSFKYLDSSFNLPKKEEIKNFPSSQEIRIKRQRERSITNRKKTQFPQNNIIIIKEAKIQKPNSQPNSKNYNYQKPIIRSSSKKIKDKVYFQQKQEKRSSSNLFNPSNFYSQLKGFSKKETEPTIEQKTHSLEINNTKKQQNSMINMNAINILKKLIPYDDTYYETEKEQISLIKYQKPKNKHREKIYVIKDNKIINSITRVNEEQMKRNLEDQIQNRTAALRNCQKKMREMSLDSEYIFSNKIGEDGEIFKQGNRIYNSSVGGLLNSLRPYKFPTIQRKSEQFNN